MKHTPGPWTVNRGLYANAPTKLIADARIIGEIECNDGILFPEGEANARLIAAAPEMLEELKRCADRLEYDPKWNKETLEHVYSVIAKAEGR